MLKLNYLVGLFLVEGKDIGVHQGSSAPAEDAQGLAQELRFNPGYVEILH